MTITGRTGTVPDRAPASPRPTRRHGDGVIATGLLILAAGTFLPWLRSGAAERTSYAADGMLRSLLHLDGLTGAVLRAWPFLTLLCAVSLGLVILRLTRTGTALATLCALAAAVVCVRVLSTHSNSFIGVATIGPAVTLAGCAVVLTGTVTTVLTRALSHRSRRF